MALVLQRVSVGPVAAPFTVIMRLALSFVYGQGGSNGTVALRLNSASYAVSLLSSASYQNVIFLFVKVQL